MVSTNDGDYYYQDDDDNDDDDDDDNRKGLTLTPYDPAHNLLSGKS